MAEISNESPAADSFTIVDLGREMNDSEQRKPWQSGIFSKTLIKKKDFRIVLISMEPMAAMAEHHTDGTLSVQMLKGAIELRVSGRTINLRAAQLLTLDPSVKHDVKAIEASVFLLTFSWPSSEELQRMKHRGYGS